MPDGTRIPLVSGNLRITEYTVGVDGGRAMPAPLPSNIAYTYCVEAEIDEAAGAQTVEFDRPVSLYYENFFNMPVGSAVPVGTYDRSTSRWVGGIDGAVLRLLSASPPMIDATGDGVADALATLSIDAAEATRIAARFLVGQTFVRATLSHFSPVDTNFSLELELLLDLPENPHASPPSNPDPNECVGSRIECQNGFLGERLALQGVPTDLYYASDRTRGFEGGRSLDIPVGTLLNRKTEQAVHVTVGGVRYTVLPRAPTPFLPPPPRLVSLTWSGRDLYDRLLQGAHPAHVEISYYPSYRYTTPDLAVGGGGGGGGGGGSRSWGAASALGGNYGAARLVEEGQPFFKQEYDVPLGSWDIASDKLGQWQLGVHHHFDPNAQTLYLGTGARLETSAVGPVVKNLWQRNPNDARQLPQPFYTAMLPDGSMYFAARDGSAIAKMEKDGTARYVAGTPTFGFADGPGVTAQFFLIHGLDVDEDGNLYIADGGNNRIRMMTPDFVVSTLYGGGPATIPGIEGPEPVIGAEARGGYIGKPYGLARRPDGSFVYFDEQLFRLWEIRGDRLSPLSAKQSETLQNADGPARSTYLRRVFDLSSAPNGDLYLCEVAGSESKVRKLSTTGMLTTLAGGGLVAPPAEGLSGRQLRLDLNECAAPAYAADGTVYFRIGNSMVSRVLNDGTLRTVFGRSANDNASGPALDGTPARQARAQLAGAAAAPDGSVYVLTTNAISRVAPLDAWSRDAANLVPSGDGREVYVFDAFGRHIETKDALTNARIFRFEYDNSLLVRVVDRKGLTTRIERDGTGVATALVGPYGERTQLSIDASGDLRSITSPANETFSLDYTNHLLTQMRSPRGAVHTYAYDAKGRLVRDKSAGRSGWTLTRSAPSYGGGYSVDMTTEAGRTTHHTVTSNLRGKEADRTHTSTHPDGTESRTVFKAGETESREPSGMVSVMTEIPDARFGVRAPSYAQVATTPSGLTQNISTVRGATLSDPQDLSSLTTWSEVTTFGGQTATTTYTAATRRFSSRSFLNREQSLELDGDGYPSLLQRPNLLPVSLSYDSAGRLASIEQGTRQTQMFYDSLGRLESLRDPALRTTRFTRDSAGRVTAIERPDGRQILLGRDSHGNVTSVTPPGKPAHLMSYALNDVEESYTPPAVPNGGATQYRYDADDLLTSIERPDGQTVQLDRDGAGRVQFLTDGTGTRSYDYSPTTGQLTGSTDASGQRTDFIYDGALLLQTQYTSQVVGTVRRDYDNRFMTSAVAVNGDAIAYTIDNDGFVTRAGPLVATWRPDNGLLASVSLDFMTTDFGHTPFGERSFETSYYPGRPIYREDYSRDALGRIETRTVTAEATTVFGYTYDDAGRLRQVRRNNVLSEDYVYDDNGNRIASTVRGQSRAATYDDQDRLLTLGDTSYTYNRNGDLTAKTTPTGTTSLTYDGLGNLREATLPNGERIIYIIDAQNRRVGKRVLDTSGNVVRASGYLYDGQLRIVAELDGSNNLVSRFVYATRATTPDYMIKGGTTYRIITDHVGSPVRIVDARTGTVVQSMSYDSFGVGLEDTSPGFQPFGFAGGLYDRDTGLVRFGARDYDPESGRWTTKDPIRFSGGDTNLYGYVINDPINFSDPLGLWGIGGIAGTEVLAGISALFGYGAQASYGFGFFSDFSSPPTAGAFASFGSTVAAGGEAACYPSSPDFPNSSFYGAFMGGGGGVFLTSADSVSDLRGFFQTISVNVSIPGLPVSISGQFGYGGGQWIASITSGPGAGYSLSSYPTYTETSK